MRFSHSFGRPGLELLASDNAANKNNQAKVNRESFSILSLSLSQVSSLKYQLLSEILVLVLYKFTGFNDVLKKRTCMRSFRVSSFHAALNLNSSYFRRSRVRLSIYMTECICSLLVSSLKLRYIIIIHYSEFCHLIRRTYRVLLNA